MFLDLSANNRYRPRRKPKKAKGPVLEKYTPPPFQAYTPPPNPNYRETPNYPSVSSNTAINTSKPERKEYTGTLVKGIATMHKSNAVPIINDEEAKDISRMRRG
jgi:hypothetical protein